MTSKDTHSIHESKLSPQIKCCQRNASAIQYDVQPDINELDRSWSWLQKEHINSNLKLKGLLLCYF